MKYCQKTLKGQPLWLRGVLEPLRLLVPLCLVCLPGIMACSDDREEAEEGHRATFEARLCSTPYEEKESGMSREGFAGHEALFTRADDDPWTPPSTYVTYDALNGKFFNQKNLVNKSIDVFFTQDTQSPLEGTFFYRSTDSSWRLSMDIESSGTYYLYGYIPKEDAQRATISPSDGSYGSYSSGAVLTINGLNTVTPADVCVIIGAQDGTSVNNDVNPVSSSRLRAGHFAVNTKATSEDAATGNYIFLLFDHLYSSLRFRFKVDGVYAGLRTIRLRRLELTATDRKSGQGIKAKHDVTITLRSNDSGASPIVGSVMFTPVETSTDVPMVPLFEGEATLATDTYTEFMGCFVPSNDYKFKLRSTYDVYDSKGTLIRQGCQAENTITPTVDSGKEQMMRGFCFSYSITVQPTFLYVLSDPDLDNPTMTIN